MGCPSQRHLLAQKDFSHQTRRRAHHKNPKIVKEENKHNKHKLSRKSYLVILRRTTCNFDLIVEWEGLTVTTAIQYLPLTRRVNNITCVRHRQTGDDKEQIFRPENTTKNQTKGHQDKRQRKAAREG